MEPHKKELDIGTQLNLEPSHNFFNKFKNCHMWRNIQLKFCNYIFKEFILKRPSQIHYSYKPKYVSKSLIGGFFRQGTKYLHILPSYNSEI